jgi:hypothetical protein
LVPVKPSDPTVYDVARFGAFLATRDKGAKVREDLERLIRKAPDGTTAVISFKGVDAVTVSFADEFIGRIFAARAAGDVPEIALVVADVNEEVREGLSLCLERRGAAATVRRGKRLELLGGDRFLTETFERAQERKVFRAAEIAHDLGISAQNANNRLKRLVDAGALLRTRTSPEGGGKEFLYHLPR